MPGSSTHTKRNEKGLCPRCGGKRDRAKPTCSKCIDRRRAARKALAEKGICGACGSKPRDGENLLCSECSRARMIFTNKKRIEARLAVFSHYGMQCACCGESNLGFLTLDHINNDGWKYRNEDGIRYPDYSGVIKAGFPSDLQTLCFNCNCGKSRCKGTCPHKLSQISTTRSMGV